MFSRNFRKKYVFIDEVQEITKWEKAIASLAKQGNADIYLTGSNAHLFSSELATLLSGRYIEFPMYSLGFDEFLQFRGGKAASREQEFHHFLRFGGLPAIHHFPLEETIIYQYTSAIYNTILLKDIIATKEREKIYIQVAYLLATPKVVQREFSVLQKIHDNYPKYVLSLDSAFGHDLDGIKY